MSKTHINDLHIFKIFASKFGGHKALSLACEFLKGLEDDK